MNRLADPESFDDDTLGRVKWDPAHQWWCFEAGPIGDRPIRGKIIREAERSALDSEWLEPIRAAVRWIRTNEPAIRDAIADKMFDWWKKASYDEEIDAVSTKEGFRDTITLDGVNFYEDRKAELFYGDHNLVGGTPSL